MDDPGLHKLQKKVEDLEKRMSLLEEKIESTSSENLLVSRAEPDKHSSPESTTIERDGDLFESRIGEYGMAWLGNIVLFFGILFLAQLIRKNGSDLISVAFNVAAVGGIYLIVHFTKKSFPFMALLFNYNAHLLLFAAALRIHFFSENPIVDSPLIGYGLVVIVLAFLIYQTYNKRSQTLSILIWIMAAIVAVASNSTHFMLPLMVVVSGISLSLAIRYGWWGSLIVSIVIVYLTFLFWMLNNPLVSRSMEVISDHQFGYVYLFATALIYSSQAILVKAEKVPVHILNSSILLNGLGFSFIFTLAVLSFFTDDYSIYFGMIAAFCIGYSIWLQSRGTWKSVAAMYAIYSFVALSISIAGIYKFPLAFYLLAIQSLLVVSIALWFRSRFIVIMNTILFMGLLLTYLVIAETVDAVNFSFAVVALVIARILNWKKQRLEIRTELIRNMFLFAGSAMILYSLHQAVPAQFVTLSWALSVLLFFTLSVVIKNKKYRWMAILTMVITVFYLFLVDLKNISLGYRILALMFISVVALGISVFYARRQKKGLNNGST